MVYSAIMNSEIEDLLKFLGESPSPYHAVKAMADRLDLPWINESESWDGLSEKAFLVERAGASLMAIRMPEALPDPHQLRFHIVGAHTDSPCLKTKPSGPRSGDGGVEQWPVEIYGGVLLNSWLDRDLGLAGRLSWSERGEVKQRLVRFDEIRARVPQLAIHLDRNVNKEGLKLNPQKHMTPVLGLGGGASSWEALLESVGVDPMSTDIQADLFFHDLQPPALIGREAEFIASARLDNLAMCHAGLRAFLKSEPVKNTVQILCCFNHEEVGSVSTEGADSTFLPHVLERLSLGMGISREGFLASLRRSFMVSADMAHALHPNYVESHDPDHQPLLGKGPVIKSNACLRYSGVGATHSRFLGWARTAGVEVQDFVGRNDLGCGSTIGPSLAAKLGMDALDVGSPSLSMHSIREMAAAEDHLSMIKVMKVFFTS